MNKHITKSNAMSNGKNFGNNFIKHNEIVTNDYDQSINLIDTQHDPENYNHNNNIYSKIENTDSNATNSIKQRLINFGIREISQTNYF